MHKLRIISLLLIAATILAMFLINCDGQTEYVFVDVKPSDSIPPATITDLIVIDTGHIDVVLSWTVPGDDGLNGAPAGFLLKKREGEISSFVWDTVQVERIEIDSLQSGMLFVYQVYNIKMGQTYTFGVKTFDDVGNFSEVSNLVEITTTIEFIDSSNLDVGPYSFGLSTADFDNNGYLDIIAAHYELEKVMIFRNFGDSGFSPPEFYETSGRPIKLACDDFDLDGKMDFVSSNYMANQLSIHLNKNGFLSPMLSYMATRSFSVVTTDLDLNGYPDIVTGNYDFGDVRVFLNMAGSITNGNSYPTGEHTRGVFTANLNDDIYPDIVAASDAGHVLSVLFNNGSGSFNQIVQYPLDGGGAYVDGGDFDDDGDIDIAVAVYAGTNSRILIMFNDGNGVFDQSAFYAYDEHWTDIKAGDMDNDGDLDLVVTREYAGNGIKVFFNNGNGVFNSNQVITTPTDCRDIVLADINNDLRLDILVINDATNKIVIIDNPF